MSRNNSLHPETNTEGPEKSSKRLGLGKSKQAQLRLLVSGPSSKCSGFDHHEKCIRFDIASLLVDVPVSMSYNHSL